MCKCLFLFLMSKQDFQPIEEIGFAKLVSKLQTYQGAQRDEDLHHFNDDASLFSVNDGDVVSTSTEIFLEGVHFDATYSPLHHLGYKITTAAVSDIYAMNSTPIQLLLGVAIPNKYSVQMVEQLYSGIDAACKDYNVELVGGDISPSHQILVISATANGITKKENVIYRKGANADELICVTGDLGAAFAGLRILMREKKEWENNPEAQFQPDLEDYQYVVQRQLVPEARQDFIAALQKSGCKPTSMIDITKGLIPDVRSLLVQSGTGAELFAPAIPISLETRTVADEMKEDVDKYAYYGGEDFEMLFTLHEHEVEKLKTEFEDFNVIGKVTADKKELLINTGEDKTIKFDLLAS